MSSVTASRRWQREGGGATLTVTLLLLLGVALALGYERQALEVERRTVDAQVQSVRAHQTAQAGLDWLVAQLNATQPVSAQCQPVADPAAATLRDRAVRYDTATWAVIARTDVAAWACRDVEGQWACHCPSSGPPSLSTLAADAKPLAGFKARLEAGENGTVRAVVIGCSETGAVCPDAPSGRRAFARAEALLALAPAVAIPPPAPLTARGRIVTTAHLGLINLDASTGGVIARAGGAIEAPNLRAVLTPGAPLASALDDHDTMLAAIDPERLFASVFGVDRSTWLRQPAIETIVCNVNCSSAAANLMARTSFPQLVSVAGSLVLQGPLTLGTADRPLALVVSGDLTLDGTVAIHGVVYARRIIWVNASAGAVIRGAAISESDVVGEGSPDFVYDSGILDRLSRTAGSFVRVPGSWKDFR